MITFDIKKINYYIKRGSVILRSFTNSSEAIAKAVELKTKNPNEAISLSMFYQHDIIDNPLFKDTFWTIKKRREVSQNSTQLVNDLVLQADYTKNPYINTTEYSSPIYFSDYTTNKKPVYLVKSGEDLSNLNLYKQLLLGVPIGNMYKAASGTDGHIVIIDEETNKMWEFWQFRKEGDKYFASWGGILDNVYKNIGIMPIVDGEYWGATATSLPVAAGTMLIKELMQGIIPHMLAFSIQNPSPTSKYPALRTDENSSSTGFIPAGQIFQFPEDIKIESSWSPIIKMMVTTVRDFGMILRDRSGCVTFYGEDPSQFDVNYYHAFFNGKKTWEVIREFPFDKLQAVEF